MNTRLQLDASALVLLSCDRRFHLTAVVGAQSFNNTSAAFGNAVHKYIEHIILDPNQDRSSLQTDIMISSGIPVEQMPTFVKACTVLELYEKTLPPVARDSNNKPLVELKFRAFSGFNTLYETTDLVGTIDRVSLLNDTLHIHDWKNLRGTYTERINDYVMTAQMPFYMTALHRYSELLPEPYRDHARAGRIVGHYVGVFYDFGTPKVVPSEPINFTNTLIAPFESMLYDYILKAERLYSKTDLQPPTGIMTNSCKYCPYDYLCKTPDALRQEQLFASIVSTSKPYNPHAFRD